MCMEDVRLGRDFGVSETNPLIAATVTPVVSNDPKRVVLVIYPPVSGTLTLSTLPGVSAGVGITLAAGDHPVEYDIQRHGALVTKGWFAVHSVGGVSVCVHEGLLSIL